MCLDKNRLSQIIGESKRFVNPWDIPESYFIVGVRPSEEAKEAGRYYEKLRYAVKHAEQLIEDAFSDAFYDFYGVNKEQVFSPAQMCSGLSFDSFVLDVEEDSICACLSNDQFLFGHFIEVVWDSDWKRKSVWIN